MFDEDALDRLLRALSASVCDQWFVLPGVGWLTVRHYKAYEGRHPRTGAIVSVPDKRLVAFIVDPDLARALLGLPPSGVSFEDDRARYLHAIRPDVDADGADEEDDPSTVTRTLGVETIADTIRMRLCAGEPAEIPGLGVFEVLEKPARPTASLETGEMTTIAARKSARFRVAETMTLRLDRAQPV